MARLVFYLSMLLVCAPALAEPVGEHVPPGVGCDPNAEICLAVRTDDPVLSARRWRGEDLLVGPLGREARFTVALSQPASATVTCQSPRGVACEPAVLTFTETSWDLPQTVTVRATARPLTTTASADSLGRLELRLDPAAEPVAVLLTRRLDDGPAGLERGSTASALGFRWQLPEPVRASLIVLTLLVWLIAWRGGDEARRGTLLAVALAVLVADLTAVALQETIGRWAPWVLIGGEPGWTDVGSPSRWAVLVAAAVAAANERWRRRALAAGVLAGAIDWLAGTSFVSDVMLGAVLGTVLGTFVAKVLARWPLVGQPDGETQPDGERLAEVPTEVRWRFFGVTWRPLVVGGWLLGLFFLYRLTWLAVARFDLAADEAQYWDWSRHLAWAYYSKPPLIGWLNALGRWFFGVETAVVRGGALVLAVVTTATSGACAHALFRDRRVTLLTMLILTVMPLSAVGSMLMTTDIPLIACWAVWMGLVAHALFAGPPPSPDYRPDASRRRAWLWSGVVLGVGLLAKYAMAYHVLTLALFFAVAREHRRWLRCWQPWASLVIGFALFAPVLMWNAAERWVGAKHVAEQAGATKGFQLTLRWLGEFVGAQVGLVSPVLFFVVSLAVVRAFRGLRRAGERFRPQLFLLATMTPIVLIVAKSLQDKVQANWAATGWLGAGVLAAWYLVARLDEAKGDARRRRKARRLGVWALGVAVALSLLAFNLQVVQQIFELPPGRDPAKKVIGWRTLGQETSRRLLRMPDPDRTFVFTPRYQLASALAFYTEGHPRTINVNLGRRMNQYDLWEGVEDKKGWDALYVVEGTPDTLPVWLARDFASHLPPEIVELEHAGVVYRTVTLWRLFDFDGTLSGVHDVTRY